MIARKLTGAPPKNPFPKGAVDTQMHMYLPGFPALPGGPGLPQDPLPDAEAYRQVMAWMGIDRVIITQGNAHQRDNTNTLACLAEMGDCARGVAVIDGTTSDAEIACPDPNCASRLRIVRLGKRRFSHAQTTAVPLPKEGG